MRTISSLEGEKETLLLWDLPRSFADQFQTWIAFMQVQTWTWIIPNWEKNKGSQYKGYVNNWFSSRMDKLKAYTFIQPKVIFPGISSKLRKYILVRVENIRS